MILASLCRHGPATAANPASVVRSIVAAGGCALPSPTEAFATAPISHIVSNRTETTARIFPPASSVTRGGFDDVVPERRFDRLEPVRDTVGDREDITLPNPISLAAYDGRAAKLARRDGMLGNELPARHDRRRAIKDIEDVRVAAVTFGLASPAAATRV